MVKELDNQFEIQLKLKDQKANDKINNYDTSGGLDTLLLQDIAMAEMEFMSQGNDLVCTFTGTGEHITISNWCYGDNYQVSEFQFKDGILKKEDFKIG